MSSVRRRVLMKAALVSLAMIPGCLLAQSPAMNDGGMANDHAVLLTAFAVNKPAQLQDVDDIAHGFPRELGRRLAQNPGLQVHTSPELLSWDWEQTPPDTKLLNQLANSYGVRYIVAGEIRDAGVQTETNLFGLTQKSTRAMELEVRLYDARSGALIAHQDFSKTVNGKVAIGRDYVFGGAAFSATPYGAAINEVLEDASQMLSGALLVQR